MKIIRKEKTNENCKLFSLPFKVLWHRGGYFSKKYQEFGCPGNQLILKIKWLLMFLLEDGFSVEDFFVYHLYEKPRNERRKFVSLYRSGKINKFLNQRCKRELVEDKSIFGDYFKDFMFRNQISSDGLSYDSFVAFVKKEQSVFIKPCCGCNGNGAFIIRATAGTQEIKEAYETIKDSPYVLETVLYQEGILHDLNPHTLNTLRVNVFNNHGKKEIINAILRSGQGEVVTDNICAGGCVSEVDVKTGAFITPFIDLSNHVYDRHPKTGVRLLGENCPCWEEVKKVAFQATDRLPGVVYASWDIAVITGERVAIVEGNTWGNFNIQQTPRQIGLLPLYQRFVDDWKKAENELMN